MNPTDKRYLTEWMGEEWIDYPHEGICPKCKMPVLQMTNRTFSTPQDSADVVARLKEVGEWEEFISYLYRYCIPNSIYVIDVCFNPTLFCEKVVEYLREREACFCWELVSLFMKKEADDEGD